MKKEGFDRVQRMLKKITPEIEAQFDRANEENAEMIVDLAKVLIPAVTEDNRAKIRNSAGADGDQLIDFGPKSKVIEGQNGPRPFVNPALAGTRKKRQARNRKAIQAAFKAVK